jgi:hypothetical protein
MAFNINDYETVEVRLGKFISEYPDFRVFTELLESSPTRFIVRASIYRTELDANPWATGLAYEVVTDRGINSTSALEVCETSALGRSLANAGYAAKGKRPSQSEMAKVVAADNATPTFKEKLEQRQNMYGAAGSKSAQIETVLRDSFAADKVESTPVVWSVGEVVDAIGTSTPNPPPECEHGHTLKTGITRGGKTYYGYVCKGNVKEHAVWAKLSANGRWFFDGENNG